MSATTEHALEARTATEVDTLNRKKSRSETNPRVAKKKYVSEETMNQEDPALPCRNQQVNNVKTNTYRL